MWFCYWNTSLNWLPDSPQSNLLCNSATTHHRTREKELTLIQLWMKALEKMKLHIYIYIYLEYLYKDLYLYKHTHTLNNMPLQISVHVKNIQFLKKKVSPCALL